MKINELQLGDLVTEQHDTHSVAFEVIAISKMGRHCPVTFRSAFGETCARYHGEAYIGAVR
ncbi:hypothetical protein [Paludibacterium denitrificans]|uniref:Uncharacterized protein n=1 Tax=Paludibacterium denitrificans TaxID=2675226 RepID=A0A844GBB0_9NEIS|nr:hypothetical protein [Paludibacterium denitrificans]MTD32581.1 hypothetical protein [Paludibacterium denitrificans]